jgi:hypothetical protein
MAPKNVRGKLVYSLSDPTIVGKGSCVSRPVGFPFSDIPKYDIDTEVLDRSIAITFVLNEKKKLLKSGVKCGSSEYFQHFMQMYMDYYELRRKYEESTWSRRHREDSDINRMVSYWRPAPWVDPKKRKKNSTVKFGMSAFYEYKHHIYVMNEITKQLKNAASSASSTCPAHPSGIDC